jgi:hypothetical protein
MTQETGLLESPQVSSPVPCMGWSREEGASNGSINRELAVLHKMLRLAYENNKLLRPPVVHKLKENAPRQGFFEHEQYEAVPVIFPLTSSLRYPSPTALDGESGVRC